MQDIGELNALIEFVALIEHPSTSDPVELAELVIEKIPKHEREAALKLCLIEVLDDDSLGRGPSSARERPKKKNSRHVPLSEREEARSSAGLCRSGIELGLGGDLSRIPSAVVPQILQLGSAAIRGEAARPGGRTSSSAKEWSSGRTESPRMARRSGAR